MVLDVLVYLFARLILVVALTAAIFYGAHLLGVAQFPLVIALLFALVIALPLGIWLFAVAAAGHGQHRRRRRAASPDRADLQAACAASHRPSKRRATLPSTFLTRAMSSRYLDDMAESDEVATADPAVGLRAVRALQRLQERLEAVHVANAREQGWSWQDIADALGVSRQAVHQKYHRGG
jgi:DNA-directed RNA polymerase specialized sigma24 family protein